MSARASAHHCIIVSFHQIINRAIKQPDTTRNFPLFHLFHQLFLDVVVIEVDAPPSFPLHQAGLTDGERLCRCFQRFLHANFVGEKRFRLGTKTIQFVVQFSLMERYTFGVINECMGAQRTHMVCALVCVSLCACVSAVMCACARACVRACVRASERAREREREREKEKTRARESPAGNKLDYLKCLSNTAKISLVCRFQILILKSPLEVKSCSFEMSG